MRTNDNAVSPVIGVILMVAITVILAAVIAAFIFGMSGNITKTRIVAVNVERINQTVISMVMQGGQDAASVLFLNMTVNEGAIDTIQPVNVGTSHMMYAGTPGNDHIIIVAGFNDGQTQVIYDAFR